MFSIKKKNSVLKRASNSSFPFALKYMWRTIYIREANKVNLNLNHLQIHQDGEIYYVALNEIALIVLEDIKCIITVRLLIEISNQGIPLIVLGLDHLPIGEYHPLNNNARTSKRYKQQFNWNESTKEQIWQYIVQEKINNQIQTLKLIGKDEKVEALELLISNTRLNDKTNTEGIAARIYFKQLFGKDFIRFENDLTNIALNFSYHIIRCLISKEIVSKGYTPTFGINHKSEYNFFNLSDDIIEVYRPIVDYYVYNMIVDNKYNEFSKEFKCEILDILNSGVTIKNKNFSILNSIPIYVNEVLNSLDNDEINFDIPRLNG